MVALRSTYASTRIQGCDQGPILELYISDTFWRERSEPQPICQDGGRYRVIRVHTKMATVSAGNILILSRGSPTDIEPPMMLLVLVMVEQ